ncbi:MAG: ribosomal RNA small subunit methyltransferase A [Deltaproteobacteria bacterium]|nr:ribosomal RNA small subunit methyltransferase A [Deltaproteobacteria bacterium]
MLNKPKKNSKTPINRQLQSYGFSPLKRFSQNFLTDERIAGKIIDAFELKEDDTVIEIGPGLGMLTERLLDTGAKVLAIEIDKGFADILDKRFGSRDNFEKIICQDALKISYKELFCRVGCAHQKQTDKNGGQSPPYNDNKKLAPAGIKQWFKVISNLPYNISTPIIFKLLEEREIFSMFLLMLQKEVAERIVSQPDTKEYGVLSIFVQLFADVNIEFDVPPSSFYPKPNVYSSVVRFTILQKPRVEIYDISFFKRVVKASFGQRRKTLLNALKVLKLTTQEIRNALEQSGIEPQARGETLSLKEFGILSNNLKKIAEHI